MGNINKQQQSCNELRLVEPRLLTPNGGGGSSAPHSRRIEKNKQKNRAQANDGTSDRRNSFFYFFLFVFSLCCLLDQETTTCCDERPFSSKRCGGNQTQRPRSGPAAPSLPSKVLCNYNWVMDDE
jgi:hypothetical protein